MKAVIRPKKWEEFQHYKTRRPPWIKFHREILDDFDFQCLQDASKALAPMLWLLASDYDNGEIPLDLQKLAFRLRMTEEKLAASLKPLIDSGFFICNDDASAMLAERKQHAMPETEERQRERQRNRGETDSQNAVLLAKPEKPLRQPAASAPVWDSYAQAYRQRYRTDPVRNAKVNGQLAQLVKRLGEEAAPVAEYFVANPNAYYVSRGHSVDCLLRDAEKLRTEWATGNRITQTTARLNDRTASNPFLKMLQERTNAAE